MYTSLVVAYYVRKWLTMTTIFFQLRMAHKSHSGIRFVGWRGESIGSHWQTSLDRHTICLRTTPTTSAFIGSVSRGTATVRGHKWWSAAIGFEPEPFFATTIALNGSGLHFEPGKTWWEVSVKTLTEPRWEGKKNSSVQLSISRVSPLPPHPPLWSQPYSVGCPFPFSFLQSATIHLPATWSAPPSCSDMGCLELLLFGISLPMHTCKMCRICNTQLGIPSISPHVDAQVLNPMAFLVSMDLNVCQLPMEKQRLTMLNTPCVPVVEYIWSHWDNYLDNRHIGMKTTHTEEGSVRHIPSPLAHPPVLISSSCQEDSYRPSYYSHRTSSVDRESSINIVRRKLEW